MTNAEAQTRRRAWQAANIGKLHCVCGEPAVQLRDHQGICQGCLDKARDSRWHHEHLKRHSYKFGGFSEYTCHLPGF